MSDKPNDEGKGKNTRGAFPRLPLRRFLNYRKRFMQLVKAHVFVD